MPVAVERRCIVRKACAGECGGELCRLGQTIRPGGDRVDPLGGGAQRDAGHTEPVRLLLQAARVGDDGRGAGDERQQLEVAEWVDRFDIGGEVETVLVERVSRSVFASRWIVSTVYGGS